MTEQNAIVPSNGNGNRLAKIEQMQREYMPILKEMIVGGRKLSDDQVRGRAAFAAQQGLDPISEVHTIVDKDGRTMAHTMSINGLRRKNKECLPPGDDVTVQFIEFPKDRIQPDWAYAFECWLRDDESYRHWQKRVLEVGRTLKEVLGQINYQDIVAACGPSPVTIGVGVVYKGELSEWKDRNFNPIERAKKRAEVNARHHRFPTNVPVSDGESPMEIVDAEMVDVKVSDAPRRGNDQLMAELGFGSTPARTKADPETGEIATEPDQQIEIIEAEPAGATITDDTPAALIVGAGLAVDLDDAGMIYSRCKFVNPTDEEIVNWAKAYRGWIDLGATTDQAVEKANNRKMPK